MKNAILLRGLPGSGKTNLALRILVEERKKICSTDSFFITKEGYKFEPEKLAENHQKNQAQFEEACKFGTQVIICDNTNMKRWHLQPYIDIAKKYDYVITEILVGNPKDQEHQALCAQRNTHGVSLEAIQRMAEGFEL